MRGFEIISKHKNNPDYKLPRRMTKHAAAYDFFSPVDIAIPAKGHAKICTGVKAYFLPDEALLFIPRSSWGTKYGITLRNSVGLFDHDYYNNETTEGEAFITLSNDSDKDFEIKKGDRFCQAFFQKVLFASSEYEEGQTRLGGVGSTK